MGFPRESKIWLAGGKMARAMETMVCRTCLAGVDFGDGHGEEDEGLRRGRARRQQAFMSDEIGFPR